ncbi:unnamed protein product [Ilex paraguariensis]|uniref:Uncharacterized protein n=1 Tax=Ilex paraguariensis TaxID=185542 RepID=A0ABC8U6Y8_9AQUA
MGLATSAGSCSKGFAHILGSRVYGAITPGSGLVSPLVVAWLRFCTYKASPNLAPLYACMAWPMYLAWHPPTSHSPPSPGVSISESPRLPAQLAHCVGVTSYSKGIYHGFPK